MFDSAAIFRSKVIRMMRQHGCHGPGLVLEPAETRLVAQYENLQTPERIADEILQRRRSKGKSNTCH